MATFLSSEPQGNTVQVFKSGYNFISASSIRTKPSIEEPSKAISLSKALSSCETGISTFFKIPLTSENAKRIKCTFFSCASSKIASLVHVGIKIAPFFVVLNLTTCVL